jgi:cytochrome c-type biogenesis protein CcmE
MKISHIIAIVIIAVAIGIIISTSGDASKYVSFKEAYQMASEGNDDKVHVVGKLKKANGMIYMNYNPVEDPNLFSFVLVDNNQEERQVIYYHPKPQDFEKSEQVVIVGSVKDNIFIANDILMKCPSKYENQETKAGI